MKLIRNGALDIFRPGTMLNMQKKKTGSEAMTMRLIMTIICWLAIGGCASHAAPPDVRTEGNCSVSAEKRPPAIRVVNINITGAPEDPIKVAPDPVCVRPGDVLWFKINGNNKKVTVAGKEVFDEWIAGGSKLNWFYVVVPTDLLPDSVENSERVYYYKVMHDSDILDPEVRVKHNYD